MNAQRKYIHKKAKKSIIQRLFHDGKSFDYVFFIAIVITITIGLAMLSSASSVEAFRDFGDSYYFVKRQLLRGVLPGVVLFLFFSRLNYKKLERYSLHFFILAIVLLISVFIPGLGESFNSARSWIVVGSFTFQPSELVKLLLILSLSGWFARRGQEKNRDLWNGLVPFIALFGSIALLVLLQPDLGTLMVLVAIGFTLYYVAGAKLGHIASLGVAGLAALVVLIARAPYRADRLMTFLHPELDPQGIGYHINQAFLALGSGGFWGLGYGQSRQKFAYLPEVMGDSIFAVIGEEMGFVISVLIIILFMTILFRGLKLAQHAPDYYARYVLVGITVWFSVQAFFNIGAMVGLLPLTGIPLPFISYGGSSMMSVLAAAGVVIGISKHVSLK